MTEINLLFDLSMHIYFEIELKTFKDTHSIILKMVTDCTKHTFRSICSNTLLFYLLSR